MTIAAVLAAPLRVAASTTIDIERPALLVRWGRAIVCTTVMLTAG